MEIIERVGNRDLAHIISDGENYYYIDSSYTFDCHFETVVYGVDKDTKKVTNWSELYMERFPSWEAMEEKHYETIETLDSVVVTN